MFTITYVFVIITHQQEGVPVYYFGILYHCNLLLLALRTKLAFKAQDTPYKKTVETIRYIHNSLILMHIIGYAKILDPLL